MPDKVLYTAEVISTGDGRNGHVLSSDHRLDLDLSVPPELDGPGGPGTNPEQLFAAGYAACFGSAIGHVARSKKLNPGKISVTAKVDIGPVATGFGLQVELVATISDLDRAQAQALVDAAHQVCPYSNATRNNIVVDVKLG